MEATKLTVKEEPQVLGRLQAVHEGGRGDVLKRFQLIILM